MKTIKTGYKNGFRHIMGIPGNLGGAKLKGTGSSPCKSKMGYGALSETITELGT